MSYYKLGSYNAVCQVCGFEFKADQLKKRWDGLIVCSQDFETRHPSDLYRPPTERGPLPWTSPEPTDNTTDVDYVASTVGVQESTKPSGTFDGSL